MRVTDRLAVHAVERPQALACADATQRLTWAELAGRVAAAVDALRAQGLAIGDRVALVAPDGVPALVAALAVLHAGGVHAPVDHTLAAPEVDAAIAAVGARWRCTLVDGGPRLVATGLAAVPDPLGAGASAFVRCSSGTTGAAKGVLLSHATILARTAAANRGLVLGSDDRVLWLLPMAYHFAVSVLLYLQTGSAIVFGAALRASATAAIARAHAVTFAYASPWHVRRLAALAAGDDLPPTLRRVVSTTAPLDPHTAEAFARRHGVTPGQGLGIIEVGLPLLGEPGAPAGRFRALPDYRAVILGPDRAPLPAGSEGELALAGPGLLDAYLHPWRPRAALLHDGAFATGDLARIETDGSVQLLGRMKDVINVGGLKVFPLEVEAVLDAHPAVRASRVRADADPQLGERVLAEVAPAPGVAHDGLEDALMAWCAARLAPLKRPAAIRVVAALAMTASGKVRR